MQQQHAPPGVYGQPQSPPGGYGQQPMQPPQAMAPYGPQGMMPAPPQMSTMASPGNAPGPSKRNAAMTMVLPYGVIFVGSIVGGILARITPILGIVGSLAYLVGLVMIVVSVIKMVNEVKAVTRNSSFAWWPMFIPLYQYYWGLILVPAEVKKAKQSLGVQAPTRGIVVYLFFWLYALAADINDMVR